MRSISTLAAFIFFLQPVQSQTKHTGNQQAIKKVLTSFMHCLQEKDSARFYSLFYAGPVAWAGVTCQKTYAADLKNDSTAKADFSSDYKAFYRHFYPRAIKELFYNIRIHEDGYIATVIFDYSFWDKDIKTNWGKESWGLIKTSAGWKITSVIFSTEDEPVNPEPKERYKK